MTAAPRPRPRAVRIAIGLALLAGLMGGVSCRRGPVPDEPHVVPRGYLAVLQLDHEGRRLGFGPFVGYYFKPDRPGRLEALSFVCFNERQFYTRDLPATARLFQGTAVLTTLPDTGRDLPRGSRINPVFFPDAPEAWRRSRPTSPEGYVHFHSCYNAAGPVRTGYWLRHVALTGFTYDMGGRVGPDSPLHHEVTPGVDLEFARIIEFDRGPRR